jgi:hypothetical protein
MMRGVAPGELCRGELERRGERQEDEEWGRGREREREQGSRAAEQQGSRASGHTYREVVWVERKAVMGGCGSGSGSDGEVAETGSVPLCRAGRSESAWWW